MKYIVRIVSHQISKSFTYMIGMYFCVIKLFINLKLKKKMNFGINAQHSGNIIGISCQHKIVV